MTIEISQPPDKTVAVTEGSTRTVTVTEEDGTPQTVTIATPGPRGPKGDPGNAGIDGADGADGAPGESAYQRALANGFVGTESEWLASLRGPEGPQGPEGPPGADGADGTNGTNGADGADGADGQSAYQLAVAGGFVGTEVEWLASLVGPMGPPGAIQSIVPGTNVTIDDTDPNNPIISAIGGSADPGLFRGEWASTYLGWSADFADGTIPPELNPTTGGKGSTAVTNVSAITVTGSPAPYAKAAELFPNYLDPVTGGNYAQLLLRLADLAVANPVQVKVWIATCRTGQNDSYVVTSVKQNGNLVVEEDISVQVNWKQLTIPVAAGDTLSFTAKNLAASDPYQMNSFMAVTGVEVYAVADPYKTGEYVVHDSALWRCLTDGTAQEPSATATDWAEVPLGASSPGGGTTATVQDAEPTSPVVGQLWLDTDEVATIVPGTILLDYGSNPPVGTPIGTIVYWKQPPTTLWDFRGLSALPSGWSRRGVASETFDAAGMSATYANGQGHQIAIPGSPGDQLTLEAKLISGPLSDVMLGPMIVDASGNGAQTAWYSNPTGASVFKVSAWVYGSVSSNAGGAPVYPVWFRVRRDGNSWLPSYSTDGITWSAEPAPISMAFTPAYISVGSIFGASAMKLEYVKYSPGSLSNSGKAAGWWDGTKIQPLG